MHRRLAIQRTTRSGATLNRQPEPCDTRRAKP
jgi:hypothetical protein